MLLVPVESKLTIAQTAAAHEIGAAIHAAGVEADTSIRRRAEYSSDASNYRVVPQAVAFPRTRDEVLAVSGVSRDLRIPLTPRGGGTSVAGNAIGPGIIIDFSRYLNHIECIDADSSRAVVQPGVVLGDLQRRAAPFGLRFGPDPSTWARCTIGGMIGNNACGPRALTFGRTADNVLSLDVVDGSGRRFDAARDLSAVHGLEELVRTNLDILRLELGSFGRQISGFSLEHLLPENGQHLARALTGTEGSCVTLLGATVRLVDVPVAPVLVVLGYDDMASAADAVPALLPHRPMAIEGLDARLVDVVRAHRGPAGVPELPAAGGWLMVEIAEHEPGDAMERALRLVADAGTSAARVIPAGPEARAIWRIREDGAGLAGRTPQGRQAWPGVEDAAVPPENLGAYLREFDELLEDFGFEGLPYGHFGDGCVHVRLDIPLEQDGATLRRFMEAAARLIASHGGSLSGEHGDGRARGELLRTMYSDRMLGLFDEFRQLFDPDDLMNPGVVVRPAPLDDDLRRPGARPLLAAGGFAFRRDGGDVTSAVHRCVGVGKCRADNSGAEGVMCPSYLATRDEKDSTRGRARVLQEMINGSFVRGRWEAPEVAESLDLCLSCKACWSECPAGVDMAALKSESLHRRYRGRLRPITHYTLGWMPRWARLGAMMAPLTNAMLASRRIERLVLALGGMDTRRSIPRFARPFTSWWRERSGPSREAEGKGRERARVVLWVDSFSNNFSPSLARSAVALLENAGVEVIVPERSACCGLTWISTGQLDGARRRLSDLLDVLGPFAAEGRPILGLEPSCTAVLRSDLLELLPEDPRTTLVAHHVVTLAELLGSERFPEVSSAWERPDLSGIEILVQPHCHQRAVMGFEADTALLSGLGANVTTIGGCCGLAGNFGMERGHYEVSTAVAENGLLPALREAAAETIFLADGLSCRTQAEQLGATRGVCAVMTRQDLCQRTRSANHSLVYMRHSNIDRHGLYIDGRWSHPGKELVERRSPADRSDVIGRFTAGSASNVDDAVDAAQRALPEWSATSPQVRANLLEAVAAAVASDRDRLAELIAREEGKSLADARGEVVRVSQLFRFFSGEALRATGDIQDSVRPGAEVATRLEPVGVVGIVAPWNFPIAIPSWKLAPALAFGNTVVLKPADIVPAAAIALISILDGVGFPPGVVNLVTGPGSIVGEAIVNHPGIDAVSFTGSQKLGRRVAVSAAGRIARVQLEMGGKNPLVVLADADLDIAAEVAVDGAFYQTGQRCTASSRLIVDDAVHDEFVARVLARMDAEVVGHPLDPRTTIGPVVSEAQLAVDLGYLEQARAHSGVTVHGGEIVSTEVEGNYLTPGLIVGGTNTDVFNRDEIFGPVAGVIRVSGFDEALAVANDTEFGLVAGICTTSLRHATEFQRRAEAGMVMVNLPTAGVDPHVSFGGRKGSSYGPREQGRTARQFFTQTKTTYVRA